MVRNKPLNKYVRVKSKSRLEHGETPDICTQMCNVRTEPKDRSVLAVVL